MRLAMRRSPLAKTPRLTAQCCLPVPIMHRRQQQADSAAKIIFPPSGTAKNPLIGMQRKARTGAIRRYCEDRIVQSTPRCARLLVFRSSPTPERIFHAGFQPSWPLSRMKHAQPARCLANFGAFAKPPNMRIIKNHKKNDLRANAVASVVCTSDAAKARENFIHF
jgi:hypothetical protein